MTICRYENVRMHDIRKMDELKVSRMTILVNLFVKVVNTKDTMVT